jgi:hypothetical protein
MSRPTILQIFSNECIGNSLNTINANYESLKNGIWDNQDQIDILQSQITSLQTNTVPVSAYNSLIQTLTSFAAQNTTYSSLSTQFRNLSSFKIN